MEMYQSLILCQNSENSVVMCQLWQYLQTSNIRGTLVSNKLLDPSDVVWTAPTGDAPTTWQHQTITWTSDLSSSKSCGIHLRALSREDLKIPNSKTIWVRSRNCSYLVTWFCYQLIAKPGNKTATVPWPDPYWKLDFQESIKIFQKSVS